MWSSGLIPSINRKLAPKFIQRVTLPSSAWVVTGGVRWRRVPAFNCLGSSSVSPCAVKLEMLFDLLSLSVLCHQMGLMTTVFTRL